MATIGGMNMSFISFMDLLGIKSVATYSPQVYHEKISQFQSVLKYHSKKRLNGTYKLMAFSDCAYIQSDNLLELIVFFQKVRQELMSREIFFNAAILPGDLGISNEKENDDENRSFIMFKSESTVKVYSKQNSFTGIGISVDGVINNQEIKDYIIKSCYNVYSTEPNNKYKIYKEYFDIVYESNDTTLLGFIIKEYIETFSLDTRAARYYLSGISTVLRSAGEKQLNNYKTLIFNKKVKKQKTIKSNFLPIQLMYIDCLLNIRKIDKTLDENFINKVAEELRSIFDYSLIMQGIEDLQSYSDCILSKENKYLLSKIIHASHFNDFKLDG